MGCDGLFWIIVSWYVPVVGCCEYGKNTADAMKGGIFCQKSAP